jgi:DNA primase
MTPAEQLLSRVEGARRTGRGWIAKCPAHKDGSPSLSISEGDDGRVLLRCFAGCSAASVVSALGMQLADLFAERLAPATPEQRRDLRERARQAEWRAALNVLGAEAAVLAAVAAQLQAGQALAPPDADRLALAATRIDDARVVLG